MKIKSLRLVIFLLLVFILFAPSSAQAQTYLFRQDSQTVQVFWNEDGTASIDYVFVFTNDPSASPIDYVDVGIPNASFDDSSISADVNGTPLTDISRSGYQGSGTGVAVGLGSMAIQPGQTGRVHVFIGIVRRVLYPDSGDSNYASGVFSPTWFGSQYVRGDTFMNIIFHLPPGVQPNEPRWHAAPGGFPDQPETALDDTGRVMYTWINANASPSEQYKFGASFPAQYVPDTAIVRPSLLEILGLSTDDLISLTFCCGVLFFIVSSSVLSIRSTQRRKLRYLPPKIAIEGHGIKRGLTAIEAAILLEQPLDKILTMILFSTVKKGAATVIKREPLEIEASNPLPEGLQPYEQDFLKAFQDTKNLEQQRKRLQTMMIELVKGVSAKMKGFSRRETVAYYRDIIQRAWVQVEAADTPQVKSERFDQMMEWTMMDKDYEGRTRDVFHDRPVFVPTWWGRYDPVYRHTIGPRPVSLPSATPGAPMPAGGVSLPHLPGSDFAASIVNGVQNFSSGVVGNLTEFTSGVTNKTNPVPVSTSSSRGSSSSRSGGGCACACACAGCACACAGGGR